MEASDQHRLQGFERGIRIAVPIGLSGALAEYFLPAPIAHISLPEDFPLPRAASAEPVRGLLGPWLLCDVRQRSVGTQAGDLTAAARTAEALRLLQQPRLSVEGLLRAHALLGVETSRSRLREAIAWVDGTSPDDATLVPPPSSALPGLLADLFAFLGRTDLPIWLMQALAYYQLIQIHPLADGNGRLARALVAALAARSGSAAAGSLLAAAISVNREGMTRWHGPVRDGDIDPYLARWLSVDRWGHSYLPHVADVERDLRKQLRSDVESDNAAAPLFALLAGTPLMAERDLIARMRWSAKTTPLYLDRLKRRGWLSQHQGMLMCAPIVQARQRIIDDVLSGTTPLFA
jgi:Fic/DOC family